MGKHARFERLVAEAKKHITETSPADTAAKLNSGEAVVVDVRDKDDGLQKRPQHVRRLQNMESRGIADDLVILRRLCETSFVGSTAI